MLAGVALMTVAGGCGGAGGERATVEVFAAASLADVFEALQPAWEDAHPDRQVVYHLAGTSTLVFQIAQGSPADVIAGADEESLVRLVEDGRLARPPTVFARNSLQIAVAAGNPEGIAELADLGREGLTVALGDERVPIGRYTASALARAGVNVPGPSREPSARAVLTKVSLGEADAGVVYATDVAAGGPTVEGVPIDPDHNVVAHYLAAPVAGSDEREAAAEFVDFLTSPPARQVLARYGFQEP